MFAVVLAIEQQTIDYFLKYNLKLTIEQILANIFLVQTWIPSNRFWYSLNGVAWYLSITVFFYIMFPLILCRLQKLELQNTLYLIVLIYTMQCALSFLVSRMNCFSSLDEFPKYIIYLCPIFRIGDFAIGCCIGKYFLKRVVSQNVVVSSFIELLIVIFIGISIYIYTYKIGFFGEECFRYNMLFTPSSVALIYCMSINEGIISKLISNKIFLWIGSISSYAFLIHQIVIRYFDEALFRLNLSCGLWVRTVVTFGVTALCSKICIEYQKNKSLLKELF